MTITPQGVYLKTPGHGRLLAIGIVIAEGILSAFLVMSIVAHLLYPGTARSATGVASVISYEGRLTDASGNPLGGTGEPYCFRFSIYDAASSGNKLWPAGTPATSTATTTDGVFNALIGAADSLTFNFYDNDSTYLNVDVYTATSSNGTNCFSGSWETLAPRQRIASTGYAQSAKNTYGGTIQVGTGAGTASPKYLGLDVKNTADYVGQSCTTSGTLWYNSAVSKALVCENGIIQAISNASATTTIAGITTNTAAAASTGTVVFSNSNGVTFGINGNTITASVNAGGGGNPVSYFENHPWYQGAASTTMNASGSSIWAAPFVLPVAVSASYIRVPVSMSHVSSSASHASTANTSFSAKKFQTDAVVIYSQGVGASSLSLQSIASGSAGWTVATTISHAAQSSQYTVQFNVTYPIKGANTSNYTTSYAVSNASYQISSLSMTLFTGVRWLDVPFATSLAAGNYWIGMGRSTTTSTQNTMANASAAILGASLGFSTIGISQAASSVGQMGLATNTSLQFQPGLGWWTTNAFVSATASMALSNISAIANNPKPYFQIIRQN